jgi:serine/threonine-protein kinase HipA
VRVEPYLSTNGLHGYFSGLLSEGWLRHVQSQIERIDEQDEFTLLLKNGRDLPGQIQVIPLDEELTTR